MKLALSVSLTAVLLGFSAAAQEGLGRRVLAADYSTKRIALIAPDGKIEWQAKTDAIHDLHMLRGGNILFQTSFQRLVEVDPKTDKVVWEYDAGKMNGNEGKRVEVHAF